MALVDALAVNNAVPSNCVCYDQTLLSKQLNRAPLDGRRRVIDHARVFQ